MDPRISFVTLDVEGEVVMFRVGEHQVLSLWTTAGFEGEVGNVLLGPRLQRTTAATEAMSLLPRHVFDLGYRRYEWKCDALNVPSRRAAERLGFTYEGTFRRHVVTKGRARDTAWFAIVVEDRPRVRAAHDAWLAPANVVGGVQRRRLGDLLAGG